MSKIIGEIEKFIDTYAVKEIVSETSGGKFLNVKTATYLRNNGSIETKEYIQKDGKDKDAAIILPITEDYKYVLIAQTRENTQRGVGVEVPAGYVENGETPIEAARRELEEETGYTSDHIIAIDDCYQDQGCYRSKNYYYIAFNCRKIKHQNLDEKEVIQCYECDREDIDLLLEKNYIQDLNSKYVLMYEKRRK